MLTYPMEIFLISTNEQEWGFPGGSVVRNSPVHAGDMADLGSILGREDLLEEEMATHSSILAWRIPWTEESGRLNWSHKELETI